MEAKLMPNSSDGIITLTPEQLALYRKRAMQESYIHRVLVALDMLVNVIFMGHPCETISARSARAATEGKRWGILMSKFLDIFQRDHGARAQAADYERAMQVDYLEKNSGNL